MLKSIWCLRISSPVLSLPHTIPYHTCVIVFASYHTRVTIVFAPYMCQGGLDQNSGDKGGQELGQYQLENGRIIENINCVNLSISAQIRLIRVDQLRCNLVALPVHPVLSIHLLFGSDSQSQPVLPPPLPHFLPHFVGQFKLETTFQRNLPSENGAFELNE